MEVSLYGPTKLIDMTLGQTHEEYRIFSTQRIYLNVTIALTRCAFI